MKNSMILLLTLASAAFSQITPPGGGGGSTSWPAGPGVTVCTGTPCTAWGTSITGLSQTLVGYLANVTSDIQAQLNSKVPLVLDTGAANAYTSASGGPTLADGLIINLRTLHANTGASTLAYNGGGALAIDDQAGSALVSGAIPVGNVLLQYQASGTTWRLLNAIKPATAGNADTATNGVTQTTANATDNAVMLADGATGRLVKNSGIPVATAAMASSIVETGIGGTLDPSFMPSGAISCTKYTTAYNDGQLTGASLSATKTIVSLAAKTKIHGITIKHSAGFTASGLTSMTISLGTSAADCGGSSACPGSATIYTPAFKVHTPVVTGTVTVSGDLGTVTTAAVHNLIVGDRVVLASCSTAAMNGDWAVNTTPLTTTFTIAGWTGFTTPSSSCTMTTVSNYSPAFYDDGGWFSQNFGAHAIVATFSSTGANMSTLSAGSVDIWICSAVLP